MTEEFALTGGCQCGAVRYWVSASANGTEHCHCSICRNVHGALFVTTSNVPEDAFEIERGAENLSVFESSPGSGRYFCKTCSCVIYAKIPDSPVTFVSTGTLDDGAHPGHGDGKESHIFWGSKVPWFEPGDDLPKADEYC